MKNHIRIFTIAVSIALIFTACQKLEMEQDTGIDDVLMWNNPAYIDNYMVDLISHMPNGFSPEEFRQGIFYANATDEAENANPLATIQNMNSGNWNSVSDAERGLD
jgi:starch-binding outer membrane protein, SusD/RagB family